MIFKKCYLLWLFFALFVFRVLAQIAVMTISPSFLPPAEEWFSGFLSYKWLLLSQILIIILMYKICLDFTRKEGFFFRPSNKLGIPLLIFGLFYLLIMLVRYTIRMSLYSTERWFGGSIPIFFHIILALFVITVSVHYIKNRTSKKLQFKYKILNFLFIIILSLFLMSWSFYQITPFIIGKSLDIRGGDYAVRIDKGAYFLTSDGTRLVADIYRPFRLEKTPTILVRIPFTKSVKIKIFEGILGKFWAERGYTVIIQGTRGRYESEGIYYPLINERNDGIETLDWISGQPWYNGKIGTWGGSVFGYTQWAIADKHNPGSSAFIIQLSSSNFYEMFYPGNAFALESALTWAVTSRDKRDLPSWPTREDLSVAYDSNESIILMDDLIGKNISFFNDWVSHPSYDYYWTNLDMRNTITSLNGPVLFMAGWFDPFLPAQLKDYELVKNLSNNISKNTRIIIGPWSHANSEILPGNIKPRYYRLESIIYSIDWFDNYLMSENLTVISPVKIYVQGINTWRDEKEWPLARTSYTDYYLINSGKLSKILNSRESEDKFIYDPINPVPNIGGPIIGPSAGVKLQNEIEKRKDVLIYTSDTLLEDMEITGPIKAHIYVSTDANSTDFTAKLVDVYPDGSAYYISDGIKRQNYLPNNVTQIQIDLWPTSKVLFKGHKVRVEISSSNYPRFDLNPNKIKANQTIYHNESYPSRIVLPIIKKIT